MDMTPTKEQSSVPQAERKYLVRVTRVPLDPVRREQMRYEGTLPEDYRARSVEAHDFVEVYAGDDADAADLARQETRLRFHGEEAVFHEALPDGQLRKMEV